MEASGKISGLGNQRTSGRFRANMLCTLSTLLNFSEAEFSHVFGKDNYTPLSCLTELYMCNRHESTSLRKRLEDEKEEVSFIKHSFCTRACVQYLY